MKGIRVIAAISALLLLLVGASIALAEQGEESEADATLSAAPAAEPGPEVVADRTATSATFRLPDGALQTHIYQTPINYKASDGEWEPIEEGLEGQPDGSGLTNGANSFDLDLPERLGAAPVRLSEGEQWVSAQLLGPDTQAVQLEGHVATYEASEPGTSFGLTTVPGGIKEDIELAGPQAPNAFGFQLEASQGLAPALSEVGAVEFRDEGGTLFAVLPAPVIFDSSPDAQPSSAAHYELGSQEDGHWRLTVRVDSEWLADPARQWPVTLDPTTVLPTPTLDCGFGGKAGSTEKPNATTARPAS